MFQHAHIKKKSFFLLICYNASSVAICAVFKPKKLHTKLFL